MNNHQALDHLITQTLNTWTQHGWTQRKYGNTTEGFCTLGAWNQATQNPMPQWLQQAISQAAHTLGYTQDPWESVPDLNDAEGRTEEDMRLIIKQATADLHELLDQATADASSPLHGNT